MTRVLGNLDFGPPIGIVQTRANVIEAPRATGTNVVEVNSPRATHGYGKVSRSLSLRVVEAEYYSVLRSFGLQLRFS